MRALNLVLIAVLGFAVACGGSSSNSSTASSSESGLSLSTNAAKSTPMIYGSLSANIAKAAGVAKTAASESLTQIQNFFKLECHTDDGSLNICPSGVSATSTDTKFSTTTLIGLIQHADMYLGNIYSTDEIVNPATGESTSTATYKTCGKGSNAAALTGHTPVYSPTTANAFVVDFGTLFDCVGQFTFVDKASYALYGKAEDNLHFAGLTSRKEDTGAVSGVSYKPSDVFQSYVRRSATGDPVILAFNLTSYSYYPNGGGSNSGQRALLLVNIATNRFVIKYAMVGDDGNIYQDDNAHLVAIGTAGYNPSNSSWVSGNYLVKSKFHDDDAMITCVQNGSTPTVLDAPTAASGWNYATSTCSDVAGFFSATGWTFSELLTWLGATDDATSVAGFSSFFDDNSFLGTDATIIPQDGTTYFPTSISN